MKMNGNFSLDVGTGILTLDFENQYRDIVTILRLTRYLNRGEIYPHLDKVDTLSHDGLISFYEGGCKILELGQKLLQTLEKYQIESDFELPYIPADIGIRTTGAILTYVKNEKGKGLKPTALDMFLTLVPSAKESMTVSLEKFYKSLMWDYVDPLVKKRLLLKYGNARQNLLVLNNKKTYRPFKTLEVSKSGKILLRALEETNVKLPTLEEVFSVKLKEIASDNC